MAAAQNGEVIGTATIGAMDETFTIPFQEWDGTSPAECTSVMAGCTGEFIELQHETGGTVTVIDDCTFRISQYTFDGEGPAVEWCEQRNTLFALNGTAANLAPAQQAKAAYHTSTVCIVPSRR